MILRLILLSGLFCVPILEAQVKPAPGAKADGRSQRLFDIKIREASAAFDKGDLATCRKVVAEAEELVPNSPVTINLRGAMLYKEKKYDEALVVFQQLIDRDANSYPGYFNTAEVYFAQEKYDLALSSFERILEARPTDESLQYRIVLVLAFMGKREDALKRAGKIPNPGQTAAYYFAQAGLEFIAGNKVKGEQWIKQSETFFPAESSSDLRTVLVEHNLIKK